MTQIQSMKLERIQFCCVWLNPNTPPLRECRYSPQPEKRLYVKSIRLCLFFVVFFCFYIAVYLLVAANMRLVQNAVPLLIMKM